MQHARLDISADSSGIDILAAMSQELANPGPPPGISALYGRKSKSRSPGEDNGQITPTRLRPSIKTTPNAPKVMKEASRRRAQQTVMTAPASSPSPTDGETVDPFTSPHTETSSGVGFDDVLMAPPSPVQPSRTMPLTVSPGGVSQSAQPSESFWDQFVSSGGSIDGHGLQWSDHTTPVNPRHGPPPMPMYSTRPMADSHISHLPRQYSPSPILGLPSYPHYPPPSFHPDPSLHGHGPAYSHIYHGAAPPHHQGHSLRPHSPLPMFSVPLSPVASQMHLNVIPPTPLEKTQAPLLSVPSVHSPTLLSPSPAAFVLSSKPHPSQDMEDVEPAYQQALSPRVTHAQTQQHHSQTVTSTIPSALTQSGGMEDSGPSAAEKGKGREIDHESAIAPRPSTAGKHCTSTRHGDLMDVAAWQHDVSMPSSKQQWT
ncbi:hypothetical protein HWV62_20636 [Athelia sp. TMB]|nr:hypothetical protein HWV62_20636 [Athelia sp. TMB]